MVKHFCCEQNSDIILCAEVFIYSLMIEGMPVYLCLWLRRLKEHIQCLGQGTAHSDCPTDGILYLLPPLLSIPLFLPHNLQVRILTGIQRLIHSDLSFHKYQCLVKDRLSIPLKDLE
jgi:hypothetical protein